MILNRFYCAMAVLWFAALALPSATRAYEFDAACLDLRSQLTAAAGTEQEVAEETETDPRLLTAVLTDKAYKCTSADKDYLKRQVVKDAKLIAAGEQLVSKCPQYINPEPVRKQLTGDDAKPDSEANAILSAFSETKRFLSYAKEAQRLHLKAADACGP